MSTIWNATYMMLEIAIKYCRVFNCLTLMIEVISFAHPMKIGKEQKRCVLSWLVPFYRITNLISRSSYPTSNLYFMQVYSIEKKLHENLYSKDEVIKDVVQG